ncbi:MAG: GDSL-type esterase/lipase family protein [Desulfobacterales bacterium]
MKTIVCHGDSLTEGSDLNPNYTWPLLVENQVKVKIINSGIGGDTSGGMLGRFYQDVVRHNPEMVLIMGGTNDLWWDLDINLIQANIFAMTSQAEYHNIAPVVALPLPLYIENIRQQKMMAPIGGWENCIRKLARLVEALSASAGESDIACLDFYHLFLDDKGAILEKYFLEDGLHPNKDGHLLMAATAAKFLKSTFYHA